MERRRARVLFETHHLELYRFVLRSCGDAPAAEDVTQEVFVRALRDGVRVPPAGSERAWLFQIARNLLIDRWRRGNLAPLALREEADGATAIPAAQALRASLRAALAQLPDAEREAFLLGQVAGLTYAEIADSTGTTEAAVRSRIYRARRALRKQLGTEAATEKER